MRRRLYLATLAGATLGSIAGCSGDGGDGDGSDGDDADDETEATDETETPDGTETDDGAGTGTPDDGTRTETEAAATLSELWTADLDINTASGGTYAVDATADGILVANTSGVYSLSAEGERRWYWSEPADFERPGFATVAADRETVFAAAVPEGVLAALDAESGDVLWRRESTSDLPDFAAIPVGEYVATSLLDPGLAILDRATGETVTEMEVGFPPDGVAYDGVLAVPEFDSTTGYDPATGDAVWTVDAEITSSVAMTGDVVIGSNADQLVGVDVGAGELAWTASLPDDVAFPVLGTDGDHAVVQWRRPNNVLRGLDVSDGSTAWEAEPDLTTIPFDPVVSDGVAVAETRDGYLALDAKTGAELTTQTAGGIGAIAADADGGVFYACNTSVTGYEL